MKRFCVQSLRYDCSHMLVRCIYVAKASCVNETVRGTQKYRAQRCRVSRNKSRLLSRFTETSI